MSGQTVADQKDLIKESLFAFLRKRVPKAQLSSIDEIILSYCVSILEELGESRGQDDFDVEGFCEMVQAFVPEFGSFPHAEVATWMFELEARLRDLRDQANKNLNTKDLSALLAPISINKSKSHTLRTPRTSESSLPGSDNTPPKRTHLLSETSDGSSDGSSSGDFMNGYDDTVYILQEMFPSSSLAELHHCVSVAEGDPGRAAQLVMDRQEAGLSILATASVIQAGLRQKKVNDDELKSRIIAKYSYVDQDDDHREYHPITPKAEPKKLVRYRDNKIVSLKGERYTEVKRDDQEEPKKPVVAVKPPRKNHNH